jgi:hypothetical protein
MPPGGTNKDENGVISPLKGVQVDVLVSSETLPSNERHPQQAKACCAPLKGEFSKADNEEECHGATRHVVYRTVGRFAP